jgi:hypothetical protein
MSEGERKPENAERGRLKEAMREARFELAERSGVVVDLRNAEVARLELLNEALDPVFADIPPNVELFDRGITPGDPPRLWIDMIAHVVMGRDKRVYRFMHDTRYGRTILAETPDIGEMTKAVTKYVARRLVERERALAGDTNLMAHEALMSATKARRPRWLPLAAFSLGLGIGAVAVILAALWLAAD